MSGAQNHASKRCYSRRFLPELNTSGYQDRSFERPPCGCRREALGLAILIAKSHPLPRIEHHPCVSHDAEPRLRVPHGHSRANSYKIFWLLNLEFELILSLTRPSNSFPKRCSLSRLSCQFSLSSCPLRTPLLCALTPAGQLSALPPG